MIVTIVILFVLIFSLSGYFVKKHNELVDIKDKDITKLYHELNTFKMEMFLDKANLLNETRKEDLELIGKLNDVRLRFEADIKQTDGIIVVPYVIKMSAFGHRYYEYKASIQEFNKQVRDAKTIKEKLCCKKGKK